MHGSESFFPSEVDVSPSREEGSNAHGVTVASTSQAQGRV